MRVATAVLLLLPLTAFPQQTASDRLQERLEQLTEVDPEDEDAVRRAIGQMLLECAALYEAFSIANAGARPETSEFLHQRRNFFQLAGQDFLAERGEPVGSAADYAEAYIELHAERVLEFSEDVLELEIGVCRGYEEVAADVVSTLEDQFDAGVAAEP